MFPIVFPVPALATGGHSVELALSTLQYTVRARTCASLSHSAVSWMATSKKICPKTCPCPDHRNLCVSFFAKEILQMNFQMQSFEMKSAWIIQVHWPVSFQEEGRGSLRQTQRRERMGDRAASQGLPEAARCWKGKGAQSLQRLPRKRSWFWTFDAENMSINFCCFEHSMCGNLLWQPERNCCIYIYTHTCTEAYTHVRHTQICWPLIKLSDNIFLH